MKKLQSRRDDWEFIFCAGDDKTDEDMFTALNSKRLQRKGSTPSYTSLAVENEDTMKGHLVNGAAENNVDVFSCTIGPAGKKTAASWYVEQPSELISLLTDFSNFCV